MRLVLLTMLLACNGGDDKNNPGGDADTDADADADTTIGPDGGVVSATDPAIDGAEVDVPAGALSEEVDLVVEPADETASLPSDLSTAGPAVHLGPDGLTFDKPVTVSIPTTGGGSDPPLVSATGAFWRVGPTGLSAARAAVPRSVRAPVFLPVGDGSFGVWVPGIYQLRAP